ncbi:MAG: hypothetical protein R8G34_00470 [Paracoccaceae bacterium]|nr:hypothetical protein [Paracoccaceae bacterium]
MLFPQAIPTRSHLQDAHVLWQGTGTSGVTPEAIMVMDMEIA